MVPLYNFTHCAVLSYTNIPSFGSFTESLVKSGAPPFPPPTFKTLVITNPFSLDSKAIKPFGIFSGQSVCFC